jgi:hypothetical protein
MKSHFRSLLSFAALLAFIVAPPAARSSDFSVTAANVLASSSGQVSEGIAGAAITAGQVVYVDASDSGKIKLADNNDTAAKAVVKGIAITSAPGAGQPVKYCTKDSAFKPGFTVAAGQPVFLSATAGGLCPFGDLSSPMVGVFIGIGTGSNFINLNPVVGAAIP